MKFKHHLNEARMPLTPGAKKLRDDIMANSRLRDGTDDKSRTKINKMIEKIMRTNMEKGTGQAWRNKKSRIHDRFAFVVDGDLNKAHKVKNQIAKLSDKLIVGLKATGSPRAPDGGRKVGIQVDWDLD